MSGDTPRQVKDKLERLTGDNRLSADFIKDIPSGGEGADHGLLVGLTDDDHLQYLNEVRGDALYYRKANVDASLATKSDVGHNHNDLYFTEAEILATLGDYYTSIQIDTLLTGKSNTGHNHDDLYYRESESDILLAGKSDVAHTHDDRYFTETEVTNSLALKANTADLGEAAFIDVSVGGNGIADNAKAVVFAENGELFASDFASVVNDGGFQAHYRFSSITFTDAEGDSIELVAQFGTGAHYLNIPAATGTLALTSQITGTNSGTNTGDVTLAGSLDYITIANQVITRNAIDVTTDITGIVPAANLGTGTSITTKYLRGDNTWQTVTGVSTFLELTDTPAAYTGESGSVLTVNGTEDALTFETLGGAAYLDVGTGAGTVAAGDHTHTGLSVQAAGTPSVRALGTGATEATAGNDSRLSDARTPTAHKTSHQSGGSDAIKLDDLAAPDDNTDLDATTLVHGLLSKLDKIKLDGIETGATADMSAAELLTAIKTVDGTGSGLDADLLDGLSSAAFATAAQGALADTAIQSADLATVATTGDYGDLINTPSTFAPSAHASSHVTGGADKIRDATASLDGLMTAAFATKLDGIEALADVTDATNVDAAGATMNSDTSTAAMSFVVDEDDMVSDSATKVPTQQSVKAYVDTEIAGVGGLDNVTETLHTASPNNTVNALQLEVINGTTNVDLVLTPKGTGAFIAGPEPDGTATGGNKRGLNAVDLQTLRGENLDVAAGDYSTISGGRNNEVRPAGIWGTIGGGQGNVVSGENGNTISGGSNNYTGGYYSTIGGGASNEANSSSVVTIAGGLANYASGCDGGTIPGGRYAKADRYTQFAYAAGFFGGNGDAQWSVFVARNKTTTNAAVELFLDGSSTRLTIPSGKMMLATVQICGIKSDGSAAARYVRQFAIKNVAGTTSLIGDVVTLGTDTDAATLIDITADDTNDSVKIEATGITSETWRWVAVVNAVEVAYGA